VAKFSFVFSSGQTIKEWRAKQEWSWARAENKARQHPLKAVKVQAGIYLLVTEDGTLHTLEHVTLIKGFNRNEWTISTGNDYHHDQHNTLLEAVQSLGGHL
jgi:hypothetical protein